MKKISKALFNFIKNLFLLLIDIRFVTITILGNSLVFIIALIMYYVEKGQNPLINNYLDALWWSFSTITTVGYGDIVPYTDHGKILGIISMVFGTGIFATYTGLFAGVFLKNIHYIHEDHIREEIHQLKREVYNLRKSRD